MQNIGNPLEFLNGFRALQLHQFAPVSGLHPADSKVGDEESDDMTITEIGHE